MIYCFFVLLIFFSYCLCFEVIYKKSKLNNTLDIYIASKGTAVKFLDTINLKQLKQNSIDNKFGTIECKLNRIGYSINKGCKYSDASDIILNTPVIDDNNKRRYFCIKLVEDMSTHKILENKQRLIVNCDESFNYNNKIALYFFSVQQDQLLYNINLLGHHLNPSLLKFGNRLLMVSMIKWGKEYEYIRFAWLNNTKNGNKDDYSNIEVENNDLVNLATEDGKLIRGHDPRLIQLNDTSFLMIYSYNDNINQNLVHSLSPHRIYVAILTMDIKNNKEYIKVKTFPPVIQKLQLLTNNFSAEKRSQKNWSPFKYKDSIYFIKSINPFHVVNIIYNNVEVPYTSTISFQDHIELPDYFDHLRGGTNALFMNNNNYYISFYHAVMFDPTTSVKTYIMGAYTFYIDDIGEFKLKDISKFPIIDDRLYSGRPAWEISLGNKSKIAVNYTIQKKKMDYIVFPMSIFFNDDESIINLSYGYQDHDSYLVQLNVTDLIKSLIQVNSIDE